MIQYCIKVKLGGDFRRKKKYQDGLYACEVHATVIPITSIFKRKQLIF